MRMLLVMAILAAALGCAWADEPIEQIGVGGYFVTESTRDFDPKAGWALSYFRLGERNWYASAEVARYDATVYFEQVGVPGRQSAEVDVTTWAFVIGRTIRSDDGERYVGAGVGYLVDDDVDVGYGVRFESSTPFGWELIAGMAREPVGLQVRYRDGGMPANTGITALLTYAW